MVCCAYYLHDRSLRKETKSSHGFLSVPFVLLDEVIQDSMIQKDNRNNMDGSGTVTQREETSNPRNEKNLYKVISILLVVCSKLQILSIPTLSLLLYDYYHS